MYEQFKSSVLGRVIGDGQCVALVVNCPESYSEFLFPGVNWTTIFKPVPEARELFTDANAQYYTTIANDHNDPNQLPEQGDVMVFDATPQAGYSNTFNNPDGHCGVCDSATSSGYTLLQQNSPNSGSPVNVTEYAWKFRPCLGWLRPIVPSTTEYITVIKGDTLSELAVKYGITTAEIETLNPQITNPNLITVGEKVRVK